MAGKLSVYDMALHGVNTTTSPVHLRDGELTKAQNWQTDPTLADGCIRRRDGMVKLNSSALAGSVKGFMALPLPSEFTTTRVFYAPINDGTTNTWRRSTDGVTWTTITTSTLQKCSVLTHSDNVTNAGTFSTSIRGVVPLASFNNRLYFPGDDYNSTEDAGTDTDPTIYEWDGTTATKLMTIPQSPQATTKCSTVMGIVPYSSSELLISVYDYDATPNLAKTRVLLYNIVTSSFEQLGPGTDLRGSVFAPYVYQGRVWICPANFVSGYQMQVLWIRPGDNTWTADANLPAVTVGGVSMVEFLGDLYLGIHSSATQDALIRKRTASTAAWSTVHTSDGSGTGQFYAPLWVSSDGLTILAFWNNADGSAPLQRVLSSTDGTTWSTELDVVADLGAGNGVVPGSPFRDSDGSDYLPIRNSNDTGVIKKRTSGGTWSTVDTINNLRGAMMALRTVA